MPPDLLKLVTMSPTPVQQRLLQYLRRHIDDHGYPPSQMEMAAALGLKQNRSARLHLEALARLGLIELIDGTARGVRLIEPRHDVPRTLQVPLLGRVAAGRPIGSDADVQRHVALDPDLFRLKPDYLLEVIGDSMLLDGILPHDLIGVQRASAARNGQIVVARIDGEFTVKRWERHGQSIRLLPRNPAYAPIEVDPRTSDFALEGLFAGLIRPA
jgi:repressor LexA